MLTIQIEQYFVPGICFNFSGTTSNVQHEGRNKLITLSTEFTNKIHFTSIVSQNSSSSPTAKKTLENKQRTSVLIAITGTFISTLLLEASIKNNSLLCRNNDKENIFCENGNVYAEANAVQ